MVAIILVLISGFFHALWNVLTKKSRSKAAFLLLIQCLSLVVFFPFILPALLKLTFSWKMMGIFSASALLHGFYFLVMSRAYSLGQISQVYPIARGTACLIAPLISVLFLGEYLTVFGWLGVFLIVSGIMSLGNFSVKRSIHGHVQLAMLMGVSVACYILIDRSALQYSNPLMINWVGTIGNILVMIFFARKRAVIREWKVNRNIVLLGAFLAPFSYLIFLSAVRLGQVAQLAPIREIGTVFGVMIGVLILKESQGKKRVFSSAIVVIGIILLGFNP